MGGVSQETEGGCKVMVFAFSRHLYSACSSLRARVDSARVSCKEATSPREFLFLPRQLLLPIPSSPSVPGGFSHILADSRIAVRGLP